MNNVKRTLYIPLYGKALVSRRGLIIRDEDAERIWAQEGFRLHGKARSKWLALYMSMRAAVFDAWLRRAMQEDDTCTVVHIGCGMDARVNRVGTQGHAWFDVDFPDVIAARKRYFSENADYTMLAADVRNHAWMQHLPSGGHAVIVMEGVSMYLAPEELQSLLAALRMHFGSVRILMDCYTTFAAKAGKRRNPISQVGVTQTWGVDDPGKLADAAGITFVREHAMTPDSLVNQLTGMERAIFRKVYGGSISRRLYRLYEFASR